MGERIGIADKKTVDEISKKIDSFNTKIFWNQYKNVEEYNTVGISAIDLSKKNYVVFEIQGEGYVRDLVASIYERSRIEIYIDNKKYLSIETVGGNDCYLCGTCSVEDFSYDNDRRGWRVGKGTGEHEKIDFLAQPISFENNVTLKLTKGYISNFYFLGGVKK